ncbi:hypothetical protein [Paenibacillus tyrfis]|uniref:hypothetical protein n=1 Tax=Paenibacillus tyrfis TaxID=1501230 RepID=UPI000B58E9FC|nr:hypothetical protein [Paenibacillus tyrfis]
MEQLGLLAVLSVAFWLSLFTMTLALFRQNIKPHLKSIIISSLIMTQISIITQTKFLILGLVVLQPVFTVLCFCLFFRLRLIHAFLVSLVVYLFVIISEMLLHAVVSRFHIETFILLAQKSALLPAGVLSILNFVVTVILLKLRVGFTFISFNRKHKVNIRFAISLFVILASGLITMMLIISSLYLWETQTLLAYGMGTILLIGLIHYLYVKELSDI